MKGLPARPRLESVLDGALTHRLTLLVADAGFGKTTLLSSWAVGINAIVYQVTVGDQDLNTCWRHLLAALRRHRLALPELVAPTGAIGGPTSARGDQVRPDAMAELLGHTLEQHLTRDLVVAFDDVHLLGDGSSARLLAALVRHAPPFLHVALASRSHPPLATARLRDQGQVLDISGAELAFTVDEVATVLAAVADPDAATLAGEVREATGGWPIAVRLAAEALREVDPRQRAGQVAAWAASEAQLTELVRASYAQETPASRRLLAAVARLDRFPLAMCDALGVADAAALVSDLTSRGLLLEPAPPLPPVAGTWYRLHPLARRYLAEQPAPAGTAELTVAATRWCTAHGLAQLAMRSLVEAGAHEQVVQLLTAHGEQLVRQGRADEVIRAVTALPVRDGVPPHLERLVAHALLFGGRWDEALASYYRSVGPDDPLPAEVAWRICLIHYLRGEHDRALAAFQRAERDEPPTAATAMTLAWAASVYWIRGEWSQCGELAAQALRIARQVDDPAALAAAHTALSMLAATEGDRRGNAAHYGKALEYAERAGDVLQLMRIRSNRASHHLEEGAYPQAMAELDAAIRLADVSGHGAFGALALTNRGEIRLRLGQLEEAQRDLAAAVAIYDDLGSRDAAYPLRLLGDLHRLQDDAVAARQAYEQARAQARAGGDRQAMVPTLAGLAQLLAATDLPEAAALAQEAVGYGTGLGQAQALLAAARVALAQQDRDRARRLAQEARQVAEARRDRAAVAEAFEVEAAATAEHRRARELAGRAAAAWAEIGDVIGRARAELTYGERLDEAAARATAEEVGRQMAAIGCRSLAARARALVARHTSGEAAPVRVRALGAFVVERDGEPVPAGAWRSRKARDLLKILVARRGRPATREQLMDLLWPGEGPAQLANRLHVLVSTLRSVLDPQRRFGTDAFVATDGDSLRVRLDAVEVDLEQFLADAGTGLALLRGNRPTEALPRLVRAEAAYSGDFLEEDLYEDWAVPPREQARAAYLEVVGRLAEHAGDSGDLTAATRYLLRLLAYDPYDERAHLRLVSVLAACGRHGDARRHYRQYSDRMAELDVEPAPFPGGRPAVV